MKSHTLSETLSFETHLGIFDIEVKVKTTPGKLGKTTLSLHEGIPMMQLPSGMSVSRSRAAVLRISNTIATRELSFSCTLRSTLQGTPCTGQYLDAQEWEGPEHLVVAGTQDAEMLQSRFPFLALTENASIVFYRPDGMTLILRDIPENKALSLHYVIAENPLPEPVECSAWYAVDIPHKFENI